jgi:adenylosuccinate synthase
LILTFKIIHSIFTEQKRRNRNKQYTTKNNKLTRLMAVDLLLGLQWGDEGKGKIVDVLTTNYDIIARFQGGPNAGHTLIFDGFKHVLHTIPSGIFHKTALNVVGNGVVIDPVIFKKELENLDKHNIDYTSKLLISRKAHLILPTHRLLDAASETSKGKAKIGSTLKGIGPTYMDKTGRNGMRVGDLELENWKEKYDALTAKHIKMLAFFDVQVEYDLKELEAEFIKGIDKLRTLAFIDSEEFLNQAIKDKKTILAEGAQGSLLDIDFGTYPFVTSSNTTAAGACTGLGVAPNRIGDVFGIFKAYTTRVGSGPFPTELFDNDGAEMARIGNEFGATTGRPRRCGWLDLVALKYAVDINGVTQLMMMKGDVLSGFETLKVCTTYNYKGEEISHLPYNIEPKNVTVNYTEFKGWNEDLTAMTSADQLPQNLLDYVAFIEKETGVPVSIVSVGPDRKQTITR